MLSLSPFLRIAGFIAPPFLVFLLVGLIWRQQLIGKFLSNLFPDADLRFIRFLEGAIIWLLMFGASQFMYAWIRRALFN